MSAKAPINSFGFVFLSVDLFFSFFAKLVVVRDIWIFLAVTNLVLPEK